MDPPRSVPTVPVPLPAPGTLLCAVGTRELFSLQLKIIPLRVFTLCYVGWVAALERVKQLENSQQFGGKRHFTFSFSQSNCDSDCWVNLYHQGHSALFPCCHFNCWMQCFCEIFWLHLGISACRGTLQSLACEICAAPGENLGWALQAHSCSQAAWTKGNKNVKSRCFVKEKGLYSSLSKEKKKKRVDY